MAQAAKGQWNAARKTLERSMPLPAVLGRICDHPCESVCKRNEAGDAVRIGALERCCVQQAGQQSKLLPLPKKKFRVAVLGSGLAGLVLTSDLSRKGYPVDVFTSLTAVGGQLLFLEESVLPPQALHDELASLQKLGVVFHTDHALDAARFEALRQEYDAVFLDREEEAVRELCPASNDPVSLITSFDNVFCGGGSIHGGSFSPIADAADGRRGSSSIDRFRQKVSLHARREAEGSVETRLYTSLTGIEPQPAVPMADSAGYTPEEAQAEAGRCIQCECMECVKNCLYLEHFKGHPKKYAREVYNNASIVYGTRTTNKFINSCMLCGLCTSICPNDFPMAELCHTARLDLLRQEVMPPSAHEFAINEMMDALSERSFLARNAPGTSSSRFLFFPGCQLAGTRPLQVKAVYDWLGGNLAESVGIMLGCCGAPAQWAAQTDRFEHVLQQIRAQWSDLGQPQVVTACSTCCSMFKQHLPEFKTLSLWELLQERGLPQGAKALPACFPLHDPCTTREQPAIQQSLRDLLRTMGQEFQELETGGALTECCGYGGLLMNANAPLARDVAKRRASQAEGDFLAYCAMCREALAMTGKRVLHILDLLFPMDADPAALPAVTLSQRRDNREDLCRDLLKSLWDQDAPAQDPHRSIQLDIAPEVLQKMETRRILIQDAQRAVHVAEQTGRKFIHSENDHFLACHRHARVTFWIEYSPTGNGGYVIHNAWSHRMILPPDADALPPRSSSKEAGGDA